MADQTRSQQSMDPAIAELRRALADLTSLIVQLTRQQKEKQRLNQRAACDEDPEQLILRFRKLGSPMFNGVVDNLMDPEYWVAEMEQIFEIMQVTNNQRVLLATQQLQGKACMWWRSKRQTLVHGIEGLSWEAFLNMFYKEFSLNFGAQLKGARVSGTHNDYGNFYDDY